MAISIFPSTAAEFVSNNFVIDMNDSTNNTADTGGVKQAGPYSISFSSGDTSFDVYLIDEDGASVGYSNNTSITATGLFSTVVILGVAQDEIISFLYQGSVNNADGEGDEPGAGAYLESITPSDLPSIDDTATVAGGNFGADTEITFESGATVLPAKSITVVSGTELLVTRPDGLVEDEAPYNLKAINPGVTPPSSIPFVLTDAVTAGSDPTWVTSPALTAGTVDVAYTTTLEATDPDGDSVSYAVTAGALPTGLSLNSTTGVISGTPTAVGQTFTVTASDESGNSNPREFSLPITGVATGGTISIVDGKVTHLFTSSDDFVALYDLPTVEYLVIGGGAGGGNDSSNRVGAGGGGGGLRSSISGDANTESTVSVTAGTVAVSVGAGGASSANGGTSTFGAFATAIGGGAGANGGFSPVDGDNGATGGGGSRLGSGGLGSNGGDGGDSTGEFNSGGGGGGGPAGANGGSGANFNNAGQGGAGSTSNALGNAVRYADGGNGKQSQNTGTGAGGDGGDGYNSGNAGGTGSGASGGTGGSGAVIVRY